MAKEFEQQHQFLLSNASFIISVHACNASADSSL